MVWDEHLSNKRVLIELTDHCNLNCFMCCNRESPHGIPKGFMDLGLYKRILKEVDLSKQWSLELFWLGESMLHPHFDEILEYTLQHIQNSNSHVNLHTNGLIFDEKKQRLILAFGEKFPWITFSIDAARPQTYKQIRGGNLQKVNNNLKAFLMLRKKLKATFPRVNIQFILMKENAKEAREFFDTWASFYKEKGINSDDNVFFKRIEVHDIKKQEQANKLYDDTIEKFELFSSNSLHLNILSKHKAPSEGPYWFEENKQKRRVCAAPFKNPVIRWDGELTVCCFDDIFLYSMGNLKDSSFEDIWYGKQMNEFRRKHIEGRYDKLLTREGGTKCKDCIGYYWPTISDEELEFFKREQA